MRLSKFDSRNDPDTRSDTGNPNILIDHFN